ncbi:MAG: UvrD-helicase domain-containing protein [Prevotella sp.]
MTTPLIVYKASAGSGKTFTLAVQYIKLLVINPQQFRNILAVTFTNKATEEMKMRIVSQMYGIWKQYPDSKKYSKRLCEELKCSEEYLRERVCTALHHLLHNYSFFRVETIDSFFQSVLRNLARELDLTANLRIELNDRQVEEMAVDKMIDDLSGSDDVMQWIMDYIYDTMREDKSWNVIGQIKNFGTTIFKDFYKEHRQGLAEAMSRPAFFTEYVKDLKRKRDNAQEAMRQTAASFFDSIAAAGLDIDDFPHGAKGLVGLFLKIKDGPIPPSTIGKRAIAAVDDPDKWVKKNDKREAAIKQLVCNELNCLLKYAVESMPEQWKNYKSSMLALQHLYQLRLLDSIERKVRSLNDEAGRFLLCDTQHLLQSLISKNDSPFIFEKIGSYLENIMIDEFQDTSVVQWQNFKVLLQECMSHQGSQNLIVGDVKQSIYRWRSGDWRLLNDIEGQFGCDKRLITIEPLDKNYRSNGNIIDFNNIFFATACEIEYNNLKDNNCKDAEQLRKAYSDVHQWIDETNEGKGLVSVRLLPSEDYQVAALNEIVDIARQLVENGVEQRKIAILVRMNSLIPLIANYFIANCPEIKIVSDEAYRLDSSVGVNIIIEALHLLTHQEDILSRYTLAYLYQTAVLNEESDLNGIFLNGKAIDMLLPDDYVNGRERLLLMPLYDLVEELCRIFNIQMIEGQTAYISTLFDELSDFSTNVTSDIDAFIAEWENSIHKKTISSDNTDGIRILSIHKSKGLEYDNVIIPFCDWRMEKYQGNMIWCTPDEAPYDSLPLLPVDFNKSALIGTIFEKDYWQESLQNTVDNLNLLYVAFTRAGRNLFVIGKRDSKNSRSTLIKDCLPKIVNKLKNSTLEGDNEENETIRFEFGSFDNTNKDDNISPNILLSPSRPITITEMRHQSDVEFKQSNRSRDFIEGDDADDTVSYIKIGSLLHNVLSRINTTSDIDRVVDEMEAEGIIDTTMISKKRILNMLHKRLADPCVSNWFSDRWRLFNECTLLRYDKVSNELLERRPDRVMTNDEETIVVDFKFGNPHDDYHDQVKEYIHLLRDMGHKNVTGYLWFVYKNIIEKVEA